MEPQLLLEIAIAPAAPQRPEQAMNPFANDRHRNVPCSGVAAQQGLHDRRHAIPGLLLFRQLAPAGGSQRVEARLAVALGRAPAPLHDSALLEPHHPYRSAPASSRISPEYMVPMFSCSAPSETCSSRAAIA